MDAASLVRPDRQDRGFERSLVRAAEYYLTHRPNRDDCSGFVCAVFTKAGVELEGSSRMLWDQARAWGVDHRRKIPSVGDVAFFDDTYDANRNGRWDDPLSHVAVVLGVDPDGTITLAHGGTGKGRTTMSMNLRQPGTHADAAGKELNSFLRRPTSRDPRSARYLAGELWCGFASFRPGLGDGVSGE